MYRSIVLATDGSSLSQKAMKAALRLARDFEATLHVVTVQPPYTIPFAGEVAIPAMYDRKEYESAAKEAALKVLDEVAEQSTKMGVSCKTVFRIDASPAKAIVEIAKRRRADLIVMAMHRRRMLTTMLLGSETHEVLSSCSIPVLVHR
ncbi:MAG: universal stress protein [Quisquiliibacterium sp.]